MRWLLCPMGFVLGGMSGCYTALDALPPDTTLQAEWFVDELGSGFASVTFQSTACVAFSPEVSLILNDVAAIDFFRGGRAQDPTGAFSTGCAAPFASWQLDASRLDEQLEFRLTDGELDLRANFDDTGTPIECDFPNCVSRNATAPFVD